VAGVLAVFVIVLVSATSLAFMYNNQREARLAESAMRGQAEAVTGYLQRMLSSADADVATRPDMTMREVLDEASARVETDLADQPLVEAAVRTTLGQAYQSLGRYDDAGAHLLEALDIRRREPGSSPLDIATAQLHVGQWLTAAGRPEEAVDYYDKVLQTRRKLLPEGAYDIANVLTSYGAAEVHLARYDEAERMIREAVAIYRAQPTQGRGLAIALTHLGGVCMEKRRIDEAATHFEEVLAIRRRA